MTAGDELAIQNGYPEPGGSAVVVRDEAPLDRDEFDEFERVIERSSRAFYDVGKALQAIRDRGEAELKARGYANFVEYGERRWGFKRSHAYRLIDAAVTVDRLRESSPMGDSSNGSLPVNERQARELRRALPENQADVWQRALALAESTPPTAALIRQVRMQMQAEQSGEGEPPYVGPYLNLWTATDCDPRFGRADYPGRLPGQFVQALLWLYTVEDDLVVDPFAGSGTTLDVCRQMGRRCAAFDLAPARADIAQADACSLLPEMLDSPASFVLLDPPYWSQKRGDYTADPRDFSNLKTVGEFYDQVEHLARVVARLLDGQGAHVAFCASQSKVGGVVYDLAFECAKRFERAGYALAERIVTAYGEASSTSGAWIARARAERLLLRGFRDILVFRL